MSFPKRHQDQHPSLIGPDTSEATTDELIRDAILEDETPLSNCCGEKFIDWTDLCGNCREHASAEIQGFTFPGGDGVKFTITYDVETLELISFEKEAGQ